MIPAGSIRFSINGKLRLKEEQRRRLATRTSEASGLGGKDSGRNGVLFMCPKTQG